MKNKNKSLEPLSEDMTSAYMCGFEKGKDSAKSLEPKVFSLPTKDEIYTYLRENVRIDMSVAFGSMGQSTKMSNDCYEYLATAIVNYLKGR